MNERTKSEAAVAGAAPCSANLTLSEREQIATIISRLRRLADKVRPQLPETDDE